MSNGDDQQMCCAAGVCCDREKAKEELANRLKHNDGTLSVVQSMEAADYLLDHFTMLPRAWGFGPVIREIQQHPYHD